ncbi:hypothetical protein [Desulfovibrio aminophilus]|uniref:hypothetical protein n=1 Tax=Desulfovibrio aminophilus TaxID=81425 RepID=UPI00040544F4|nr:hypothetical protein [Desulfovibrio aminophilus]
MLWKQTYTGRMFFPLAPDPAAVVIEDVARSLAMQCRFNGHVRRYYSVAEHSVLVSRLAPGATPWRACCTTRPRPTWAT